MTLQSHIHRLIEGTDRTRPPLLLLHGSAGSEDDLLPLAADVAPGSTLLAIRGTVPFDEGSAFFRRFENRTVDEVDIRERCVALADFIAVAAGQYGFDKAPIALGFSNGAIMAAALLLLRPQLLSAAVLLRPLSPFSHDLPIRLGGKPVVIIDGAKDRRRSPGDGERLATCLTRVGACVSHHVLPVGHSITASDADIVRDWLARVS